MKKIFKLLVVSLLSVLLVACGNSKATKSTTTENQIKAQLVVTIDTNKIDEQVTFSKGDTVMDVLKANFDVKEKDGFITAIDGKEQNEKEKIYWMFDINGELAPKAADQIELKEGDKVEFFQEKF